MSRCARATPVTARRFARPSLAWSNTSLNGVVRRWHHPPLSEARKTVIRRIRRLTAVVATPALPAAGGCTGSSLSSDGQDTAGGPIRIGLMWPQSGILKTVGDDFAAGWKLYLDTHGGKLGGHEIKTTLVDEGDGK